MMICVAFCTAKHDYHMNSAEVSWSRTARSKRQSTDDAKRFKRDLLGATREDGSVAPSTLLSHSGKVGHHCDNSSQDVSKDAIQAAGW